MQRPRWTARSLSIALAAVVAFHAVSCGTLLHPERRGQPPGGRLDPAIVLLDAAGLLLFLVPGIIAFAVDFSTGAIYLPPEYNWAPQAAIGAPAGPDNRAAEFVKVEFAKEDLTRARIERVVRERTGRVVVLDPGTYRAGRLTVLDEFDVRARQLADADRTAATQVALP